MRRSLPLLWLSLVLSLACATRSYQYQDLDAVDFRSRAETRQERGVRVTAAVPSEEEAEAIFGIPVYQRGIQPVWLEVANGSQSRVRFAPVGVDRDYFSPLEVAYMHRSGFTSTAREQMDRRFRELAMPRQIWPGETESGFVFTQLSPGTKGFNVDLFGATRQDHSFTFFLEVPGRQPDHADFDLDKLYAPDEIREYDRDGFRKALAAQSCCTTDSTGEQQGLPLNVVLVGTGRDALHALLRAGWYETRRAEKQEVDQAQHWDGRPPDAVFRIQRGRKHDRNKLRVWLSPMRVDGEPVWLGQITHYIGRVTELGRAFMDPRLDPDVDDSRSYMLQIMWYSQGLPEFAWLAGAPVPLEESRVDFNGASYFTDGYRIVLWLSGAPFSQLETQRLPWDRAPHEARR